MKGNTARRCWLVFKPFRCWPYKKWFALSLIALGIILLLCFVPLQIWLSLIGLVFVVAGVFLLR